MSVTTLAPSVYAEISSSMDGLKAADSAPVPSPGHQAAPPTVMNITQPHSASSDLSCSANG